MCLGEGARGWRQRVEGTGHPAHGGARKVLPEGVVVLGSHDGQGHGDEPSKIRCRGWMNSLAIDDLN